MDSKCKDCGGALRVAFVNYLSCRVCGHVFPKGGE